MMRRILTFMAISMVFASCAPLSRPSASKTFHDAREALALGRYEQSLAMYREIIKNHPTDPLADDAFMHIAQIHLAGPDTSAGRTNPDYAAARDTLDAMLRGYPRSEQRFVASNLLSVLRRMASLDSMLSITRESLVSVSARTVTESRPARSAVDRSSKAKRLRDEVRKLKARNAKLVTENHVLDSRRAAAVSEIDRLKRLLRDLESGLH